jgi:predicted P-loop ATPase
MKNNKFKTIEEYLNEKYIFRSNTINQEIEIATLKEPNFFTAISEADLLIEINKESRNFAMQDLKVVLQSSQVKKFNPLKEYFEKVKPLFDSKKDYILELSSYVKAENQEWFDFNFKKMLVRAIACTLDPKVFNKQVFVLVQEDQNYGKTTFLRWLCPPDLSEYIAENINLDKDGLISLTENFIINLDELSLMSKVEINGLKSFISKDKVKVRPPYGHKPITKVRIANFVGSTNLPEFLTDSSNVRWLCFNISNVDWGYSKLNINMVWSQAYNLYLNGFEYELNKDDIQKNEENNQKYLNTTSEYEMLVKSFLPGTEKDDFKTTSEILDQLILEHKTAIRLNVTQLGKALNRAGFIRAQKYRATYQIKGYWVKRNFELENNL